MHETLRLSPAELRALAVTLDRAMAELDRGHAAQTQQVTRRVAEQLEPLLAGHGPSEVAWLWARARKLLADSHQYLGEYATAVTLLEETLARLARRGLEPARDAPDVANSLAVALRYAGEFDRAAATFEEVLAHARRSATLDTISTATILHNLSGLALARGRPDEALDWAEQARTLRSSAQGAEALQKTTDEASLAAALDGAGRHGEAEIHHREVLQRFVGLRGPCHYDVAAALGNLAACLHAQERYEEAEPYYQRSLDTRRELGLASHPETAVVLNNLALLHWKTDRLDSARRLMHQALHIMREALGDAHPRARSLAANCAKIAGHCDAGLDAAAQEPHA
ncbi:tetratricopeptide repeat protein [Nannocystis radixulma]|uniref:Tetratricopeptide repeat protein n=1 Tax=Nannocystis radixulma TaxID=2995305 RepID=A0ABT5BDD0_9BACT|nr:tetratricopeptide repeat protein [Nannocystis radixulma]MDC0672150.1 tetratricopeptide repeat protein [Nannocystis radixulma]